MKGWTFAFLVLLSSYNEVFSLPEISPEILQIIEDWAPLVWIHSEEKFNPSSIEFHFNHTQVRDKNHTIVQADPTRYNVLTGDATRDYFLNTVPDLTADCPTCLLDWFDGEPVAGLPTYVYVKDHNDSCGTVDVAYRLFYPYNYGKDVCVGLEFNETCEPFEYIQEFGNHVGDWEHYSIRIKNLTVTQSYVSVHSFGAYYRWNESANMFDYVVGEDTRENKIDVDLIDAPYPESMQVVEGFHAEMFSANGSHGMWASNGSFEYLHLVIALIDECDRGTPWRTWENMEIVLYEEDFIYDDAYTYINYQGRWGNDDLGCYGPQNVSQCFLGSGPRLYDPWPDEFSQITCLD